MQPFAVIIAVAAAFIGAQAAVPILGRSNVPLGDEASYLITSLPGESSAITTTLNGQYSGYIPISHNTTSKQLVIWLNGGPGCSSLLGSFVENGPVQVGDDGSLAANAYSWHNRVNMLYVEQPAGVGFSFTTAPAPIVDELQIAADFYTFLNNFYKAFPETKSYELYITGESRVSYNKTNQHSLITLFYPFLHERPASTFPYIASELVNRKSLLDGSLINLVGVAIGNGLLSNVNQYAFSNESIINDRDFLVDSSIVGKNVTELSLIDSVVNECLQLPLADREKGPSGLVTFCLIACHIPISDDDMARNEIRCYLFNIMNATYVNKMDNSYACLDIYNIKHDCGDMKTKVI
ncbi:Cell death protease [Irineochytrium annulatum]|nr:Cell death protease [Irineochytrium annulatum]